MNQLSDIDWSSWKAKDPATLVFVFRDDEILLINKKTNGRVPAIEVMTSTRMIQECIKDPTRTIELTEHIGRGRSEGMQSFDQHLLDLLRANKISVETALAAASNPADFQTKLDLEGGFVSEEPDDEKPETPLGSSSVDRF